MSSLIVFSVERFSHSLVQSSKALCSLGMMLILKNVIAILFAVLTIGLASSANEDQFTTENSFQDYEFLQSKDELKKFPKKFASEKHSSVNDLNNKNKKQVFENGKNLSQIDFPDENGVVSENDSIRVFDTIYRGDVPKPLHSNDSHMPRYYINSAYPVGEHAPDDEEVALASESYGGTLRYIQELLKEKAQNAAKQEEEGKAESIPMVEEEPHPIYTSGSELGPLGMPPKEEDLLSRFVN